MSTLDIPKRQITVFTGVSGSGKSSLVFDTIAAESQRLINETYPAFIQHFLPQLRPARRRLARQPGRGDRRRPAARWAAISRSTVGTVDRHLRRMLPGVFARLGVPRLAHADRCSRSTTPAACAPTARASATVAAIDEDAPGRPRRSRSRGRDRLPELPGRLPGTGRSTPRAGFFDRPTSRWGRSPRSERRMLLYGPDEARKMGTVASQDGAHVRGRSSPSSSGSS